MTDLLPTGHCFDDALEYLNQRVLADPSLVTAGRLELVHGIAGGDDGTRYAHGWCEEDGMCWDAALADGQRIWYAVAAGEYYAARRISETTRYTVRAACLMNVASGHYGPWVPAYRALCRSDGRVLGRMPADATGARVRSWG